MLSRHGNLGLEQWKVGEIIGVVDLRMSEGGMCKEKSSTSDSSPHEESSVGDLVEDDRLCLWHLQ